MIDLIVVPNNHKDAWKEQKVSTASVPTALSFEHYTTAVSDPTLNNYDCLLRSAQLEFRFAPCSSLSVHGIEILKKLGMIGIDDMRLIQLIHPVFQINDTLVWKKVLVNAEICDEV